MFVAGEHCDHETRLWTQEHFGVSDKFEIWGNMGKTCSVKMKEVSTMMEYEIRKNVILYRVAHLLTDKL